MFDAKKLLEKFLSTEIVGGLKGQDLVDRSERFVQDNKKGLAVGAAGALLVGTGAGRRLFGGALQLGGIAVVGTLAYQGYKNWKAGKPVNPFAESEDPSFEDAPEGSGFSTQPEKMDEDFARALLIAMICAAKSDGHVDPSERAIIGEKFTELGLLEEEWAFVEAELAKKINIDPILAAATSVEKASELYVASLMTVDLDGAAEKGYLVMLAARLGLDPELVDHLNAQADAHAV